jgi:formamidopyrimidine-DNA glycosylase
VAELPNKQTRVVLKFKDGVLFFNDQRKFGFMKILHEGESDDFIERLGPEPWQETAEDLYKKFQKHKGSLIKAVLLDQSIMAGLGNIYTDEALYFAKVKPTRRAGDISKLETEKILEGARVVMERSIDSGGSTMKDYVKADGTKGDYLDKFAKVFGRRGKKCERCGATIIKTKVAGRGTYICPECQK